ncbi:unnamed protein product [Spirodela intermedia]|uniref:SAM-dependent MTase RsmB/NOP-type domain-containing protein n=1 Tax=Spirodela intermedia TaxID=51605 RepID=A0A7I8IKH5_SPIIN|nr:unnamed protein product [Spirodela intermedia]CAA6657893.1 unnamed protein product [Spirodela intermedia]
MPFVSFLEENDVDPFIYSAESSVPRYVRVKPGCQLDLSDLEDELQCRLDSTVWLEGFFAIPPQVQIARSDAYRKGKIYGMDAASGAAVVALNVLQGDHVLDLCAAPALHDLRPAWRLGTITGVDAARHRLNVCRSMLLKYSLGDNCRLFFADGTSFSFSPMPSRVDHRSWMTEVFEEWSSRRTWKERKNAKRSTKTCLASPADAPELIFYGRLAGVVGHSKSEIFKPRNESEMSISGYDKVLVDSECTHDGSVKHIQKFERWGWETLQRRVLDAPRTDNLTQLQLKLLTNGFRLLKAGGSLVYSTCSLTVAQNEDVVERFLSENPSADLQDVDAAKNWPCRSGKILKTLRFDPSTSRTSGLFIAKIMKMPC